MGDKMPSQKDGEMVKIGFTVAAFIVSLISLQTSLQTRKRIDDDDFEGLKTDTAKLMRKNIVAAEALSRSGLDRGTPLL